MSALLSQTRIDFRSSIRFDLGDLPGAAVSVSLDVFCLRTSDDVEIHGWFVPGSGSRVLLFFHGNAGNISHRLESLLLFRQLGLSQLIIDYRGYGRSSGRHEGGSECHPMSPPNGVLEMVFVGSKRGKPDSIKR